MAGRFTQRHDRQKAQPATAFIVLAAAALLMGKRLQLLEMGDDTARALGVNAEGSRLWLMLFGVTLTAAVTATAGPISFIALAAPQIARRLAGQSSVTLTSSALMGATLLLGADVVSQHLCADPTAGRGRDRLHRRPVPDLAAHP